MVKTELQAKYRNMGLGVLWAVLDPLMMMGIYILLIRVIFERGGEQYPALLLTGLLVYRWFSYASMTAVKAITTNARLVHAVKFPLSILGISRNIVGLVNFLAGFIVLIPILVYYDAEFSLNLLWLPVIIFFQFLFVGGFAVFISVAGVYIRDLQNAMQFAVRLALYASPVLYDLNQIPAKYITPYLYLNPFASLINAYKNILVIGEGPGTEFMIFVAYSLLFFFFGFYQSARKKSEIAKVL
jgi:ABC-type polysaccharide/polyol phosphate export permease